MAKYCPECASPLNPGATRCACGWREEKRDAPVKDEHGRCCVEVNGQRCPATGTVSDTTRADDGTKWYCRWHHKIRDYPSGEWVSHAQEVIDDMNQNRPSRLDWRDELMREKGHI